MRDAPWHLYHTSRCLQCGVGVPMIVVLRGTHVCDPDDLLTEEAVGVAEQIKLMHFEIHEYLQSSAGRQSRSEQWCREHER